MALVSFQILNEAPDKSTKHVFSGPEVIVRLFELLRTLTEHQQSGSVTCLKNPNQCCGTSLGCSSTKILLCSTLHVEVEVHCEQLSLSMLSILSDLNSTLTSQKQPNWLCEEPVLCEGHQVRADVKFLTLKRGRRVFRSVRVSCSECDKRVEVMGTSYESIKQGCAILREQCDRGNSYFVT